LDIAEWGYLGERHFGSTGGTPYGIAATPSQFGLRWPGPRTPIKGLYFAATITTPS
jgi:phytoene dehydrogenase-like protein